jgi:hypothetical protein
MGTRTMVTGIWRRWETQGKHRMTTDTSEGKQTADPRCKLGQGAVVGFNDLGSNPAWSASSRSCESLVTQGRYGFLGASLPDRVQRLTSLPSLPPPLAAFPDSKADKHKDEDKASEEDIGPPT